MHVVTRSDRADLHEALSHFCIFNENDLPLILASLAPTLIDIVYLTVLNQFALLTRVLLARSCLGHLNCIHLMEVSIKLFFVLMSDLALQS